MKRTTDYRLRTTGLPTDLPRLLCPEWEDYALLDSGGGQKLERFGPYTLVRPEPAARWRPTLARQVWEEAHAILRERGKNRYEWEFRRPMDAAWLLHYHTLTFRVRLETSRHLGVFPENAAHWDWIAAQIQAAGRPIRVLNLFGYTGLATLAAAQAGAAVTHVDAAAAALKLARENQSLSGLADHPIRWLEDDALKFVQREARRGSQYDGIMMDPPRFGRGPQGQVWEFFAHFPLLCAACRGILSPQPLFVVATVYALNVPPASLRQNLDSITHGLGGDLTVGELATRELGAGRVIPNALFGRWTVRV